MWPFGRWRKVENLGLRGERQAKRFLKRRGLKILATNYRSPTGEIDLIALDRSTRKQMGAETIVFVEVKTRTSDYFTGPESAVNRDKKRRIKKVARYYLAHHPTDGYNVRYDIVSIVARDAEKPQIKYIPNAF